MADEKPDYELDLGLEVPTTASSMYARVPGKITIYKDRLVYYRGTSKRPDLEERTVIRISDIKNIGFDKEYYLGFIPKGRVFRIYTKDGKSLAVTGMWTDYSSKVKSIIEDLMKKTHRLN